MSFWRCCESVNAICHRVLERNSWIRHAPRRWKKVKRKWQAPQTQRKTEPSFHALRHFDDHYQQQFGTAWPSIRLGLLSPQKYGALVNNYEIVEETEATLRDLGAEDFVQPVALELARIISDQNEIEDTLTSDSDEESGFSSDLSDADTQDFRTDFPKLPVEDGHGDSLGHMTAIHDSPQPNPPSLAADKQAPWEDKYIVTPGYEARMEYLTSLGALESHQSPDFNQGILELDVQKVQRPLSISPHLRCFVFEGGSLARFPPSKLDSRGFFLQYYALDAASVLPVIALDVRSVDVVLDMCAAPGGKTLAIMQTVPAGGLVANEPVSPRRRRLQNVLTSYLGFDKSDGLDILRVTSEDGRMWGEMEPETYDKVLVDVPCTTDRLSATNNENSIFAVNRTKERWELPKLQSDLLCAGLRAVKPGGDVVYSTCSLSQQQNDAVIESALYLCQTEHDMEVAVVDLSPLTQCLGHVFKFWDGAKHGQLVLPNLHSNFGPTYFCKLHRVR